MALALALAAKGRTSVDPNPAVGCLVVRDGEIVGQGWHVRAGGPHAEVHALNEAGERAQGATVYVTLEPCAHHGRTPPCTEALLGAGVRRLVAAVEDPDPRVRGRGLEALRAAGCLVEVGLFAESAMVLNRGFFTRHRTGRPWVVLKIATSIDGALAAREGVRTEITGAAARADVQCLRAWSSAILTGAGTVQVDDPRLDVRLGSTESDSIRQPLRLVWDRKGRTDPQARIYRGSGPCAVITTARHAARYAAAGIEPLILDSEGDADAWSELLGRLAGRDTNVLLIEAGARLTASALAHAQPDEIVSYVSGKFFGGGSYGLMNTGLALGHDRYLLVDVAVLGTDVRTRWLATRHESWLPWLRQGL